MTDTTRPESKQVQALFEAALDLPDAEAAALLDRECAGKLELRAAVERLLRHDRAAPAGFLAPENGKAAAADAMKDAQPADADDDGLGALESARIGRFRILRRLAGGGMGVVLVAYDEELERRVAIKVLRRGLASQAWLRREAQALARLSHPNVVHIHEVGEHEGRGFLAMELVLGPTLRRWLDEDPRTSREIVKTFLAAGRGLAGAHAAGLVHRDFKPDNVLIGRDGRARVVDFGIASLGGSLPEPHAGPGDGAPSTPSGAAWLDTGSHALMGTPAYMSPEQFLGERVTAASDQFSFCVALYRALYKTPPFAGDTMLGLRTSVVSGALKAPPEGRDVPGWLGPILLRGMARHAAARFPTMNDLLAAIEAHHPRDPDLDPSVGSRERRLVFAGGLAVGAVLLTAIQVRGASQIVSSPRDLVWIAAAFLAVSFAGTALLRRRILQNAFGRRVAAVFVLLPASMLVHRLAGAWGNWPVDRILAGDLLLLGGELVVGAITLQRRLAFPAAAFLVGAAVATFVPEFALAAMSGSGLAALSVGLLFWRTD